MSAPRIVFVGPSLAPGDRERHPALEFRPPAACGDVYRAASQSKRPAAIALIDGHFETAASPWHKELLWALSRGIPVIGASSLGALRAAEMQPYGMLGCGRVFRDYASGRLSDDDEVAVVHGPAELGWQAVSVALVNIRATLALAARRGVLDRQQGRRLATLAKAIFYKERDYATLLAAARREGWPARELARLGRWLEASAVDVKRDDALALLRRLRRALPPPRPRPRFVTSRYWEDFLAARGS